MSDWASPPPFALPTHTSSSDFVALVCTMESQDSGVPDAGVAAGPHGSSSRGPTGSASPSLAQRKIGGGEPASPGAPGGEGGSSGDGSTGDGGMGAVSSGDAQLVALTGYLHQCDDLLQLAAGGLQLLDQLEAQHAVVAAKTGQLHASCKKLTEQQVRALILLPVGQGAGA